MKQNVAKTNSPFSENHSSAFRLLKVISLFKMTGM